MKPQTHIFIKKKERERKKKRGEKVFEREKSDTLLETQKFKKIARQKKTTTTTRKTKKTTW